MTVEESVSHRGGDVDQGVDRIAELTVSEFGDELGELVTERQ